MYVRVVVCKYRFGYESYVFVVFFGDIFDDVFVF